MFREIGYECRPEHSLREATGLPIRVDLFCRRQTDSLIVEVKTSDIGFTDITRLAYLGTLPALSETALYLALPKNLRLSDVHMMLLIQNNIRIIWVGSRDDITIEHLRPTPELGSSQIMSLLGVSAYLPKRSIPQLFLEKLNFQNVAYAEELNRFVEEYGSVQSASQEIDMVLKYIKMLWAGKYEKGRTAKAFENFSTFEPVLKKIGGYRDHFTHPFQVFLLGSLIISRYRDLFETTIKKKMPKIEDDTLDFSWLLASTFHDFCYPIQMFNEFTDTFFSEFLQTKGIDISIDLRSLLLDGESLNYVDQLVSLFDFCNSSIRENQWVFNQSCVIDKRLRRLFLEKLAQSRDHGMLSSMTLLRKILQEDFVKKEGEKYLKGRYSTDVYPAALAIALHSLIAHRDEFGIPKIRFENFPLIVLLIYTDLAQEWGRPSEHRIEFDFVDFQMNEKEILTEISLKKREDFEKKREDFKRAFKKLSSSQLHFSLKMICEEDGAAHIERIPSK